MCKLHVVNAFVLNIHASNYFDYISVGGGAGGRLELFATRNDKKGFP